jgi:serine/threonine protein phosphatase 1
MEMNETIKSGERQKIAFKKEKKMSNHYIIGDIHGEYQTLLALVEKLPADAKLIFLGDLIDRGSQSREVVAYIREHNYPVVRGNHEGFMMEDGQKLIDSLLADEEPNMSNDLLLVGAMKTMISYGLLEKQDNVYGFVKNMEGIAQLQDDIDWMRSLPLYIKMDNPHNGELPIVISHASIGDFWGLEESDYKKFEFYITSNRKEPSADATIFNIYGHTNVSSVVIGERFINLDTGCGRSDGKGFLSAYCLETQEVVS